MVLLSTPETRLLSHVARLTFGRSNAWTTLDLDESAENLVDILVDRGYLSRYGENGLRITEAGVTALEAAAWREPDPEHLLQLEQDERERHADLRSALGPDYVAVMDSLERSVTPPLADQADAE